MNCHKACQFLSAYMDGELPGVEHRQVRTHLQLCSECKEEYEELLQMKRILSGLRIHDAGQTLPTVIIQRVEEEESKQPANRVVAWFGAMQRLTGSAIAPPIIGLGFGLTAFVIFHITRPQQPSEETQRMNWSKADLTKDAVFQAPDLKEDARNWESNHYLVRPMGPVRLSLKPMFQNPMQSSLSEGFSPQRIGNEYDNVNLHFTHSR